MKRLINTKSKRVIAVILALVLTATVFTTTANPGAETSETAVYTEVSEDNPAEFTIDPDNIEVQNDVPSEIPVEDAAITEEVTSGETTELTTEQAGTEAATTEEVAEEVTTEATTEATEEVTLVTFDHVYETGADLSKDFSSCELLVKADPSVFTKNTNVVSELDGVYLLRFNSAEETKNAYSYYYDKVSSIEINAEVFTISTADTEGITEAPATEAPAAQTPVTTEAPVEDVADLSALNSGDDALSNVTDLPDVTLSNAIALIDTGADGVAKAVTVLGGGTGDDNGHGNKMKTAMLSVYPDAQILSIKAVGSDGRAQVSDIYAAIKYAIDADVKVINLSIAARKSADTALVEQAVNEALAKGIVVVGAAGNQGMDASSFVPGGLSGVITAGSCDENGLRNSFSNYGSAVDYNVVSGSTSEASAVLAALIAKNGVSGLSVNDGTVFATDYVPSAATDTDSSEEESTTEITTESTTEAATTEEVTEETTEAATPEDATGTDGKKKPWDFADKLGDLIDGLFHVQKGSCAAYVASRLGLNASSGGGTYNLASSYGLRRYLLANGWEAVNTERADYETGVAGGNAVADKISKIAHPGDVIFFYDTVNPSLNSEGYDSYDHIVHSGLINNTDLVTTTASGNTTGTYASPTYDYDSWSGKNSDIWSFDPRTNKSISNWYCTASDDKESRAFQILRKKTAPQGTLRVCKNYEANLASVDSGISSKMYDLGGANYGVFKTRSDAENKTNPLGYCFIEDNQDNVSSEVYEKENNGGNKVNLTPGVTYYIREMSLPSSGLWTWDNNVYEFTAIEGKYTYGTGKDPSGAVLSGVQNSGGEMNPEQPVSLRIIKSLEGTTSWSSTDDISGASYGVYTNKADADAGNSNAVGYCYIPKDSRVGIAFNNVSNYVSENMTGGRKVMLSPYQQYYIREVKAPDSGAWALDTKTYGPFTIPVGSDLVIGVNPVNYDGTTAALETGSNHERNMTEIGPEGRTSFDFTITKATSESQISCVSGNPNYSLNGAQYTIYTDAGCTQVAKDENGNDAVVTISAQPGQTSGTSNTIKMRFPAGSQAVVYYVKETKKPDKGYVGPGDADYIEEVKPIVVTLQNIAAGNTHYSQSFTEKAVLDPMVLSISKVDAVTGESIADGAGSLEHAQFTMNFYAVDVSAGQTYTAAQLKGLTPTRSWVFQTLYEKADGKYGLYYDDAHKVSGSELFTNSNGEAQIPLGYITIEEKKAPEGYTKEDAVFNVTTDDGSGVVENGIVVARADANGQIIVGNKATSLDILQNERPLRSDVAIVKKDERGNAMKDVKFKITNMDTGEAHIIFTGEDGIYDSSLADGTTTNLMDEAEKYLNSKVWFEKRADGSTYISSDINALKGSLNYGTYKIEELRCEGNAGKQLMPPLTFTLDETLISQFIAAGQTIKLFVTENGISTQGKTLGNMDLPTLSTKAVSVTSGTRQLVTSEDETIKDTISYTNLREKTTYVVKGSLQLKHKDGTYEPYTRGDGSAYEVVNEYTTAAKADADASVFSISGEWDMEFEHVDTTKLKEGEKLVVFEEISLKEGTGVKDGQYDYTNYEGEKIFPLVENDINNEDQTVSPAFIHTDAKDSKTNEQVTGTKRITTIVDSVKVSGLIKGQTYDLKGQIHVWGVKDGATFTDATNSDADNYEKNVDIYTREELEAHGYEDLGVLKNADGTDVTGHTEFTADGSDPQEVLVEFTFDASLLAGSTIVIYEDLYENGVRITTHSDITDERQTIHHPSVTTSVRNNATLTREALADGEAAITDVVAYKNLLAGKTYTAYGILMNKKTKKPLVDADGNYVTGYTTFTIPEVATDTDGNPVANTKRVDGTVNVAYSFNTEGMAGLDVVVYERIVVGDKPGTFADIISSATGTDATPEDAEKDDKKETDILTDGTKKEIIAKHEDLSDGSQTIHFPSLSTTATGDVENLANADELATVTDAVDYKNLRPNTSYEVTGTLHVQQTDENGQIVKDENGSAVDLGTLKDADGKEVTVTKTFTTGEANNDLGGVDGTVTMEFWVNASMLAGQTVTVFEHMHRNGVLVGMHADINDEGQTIHFPRISTSLTDKQTKNKISYAGSTVTLVDTVTYDNLIPGKEYVMKGTLHVKNTGYKAATASDAENATLTDAEVIFGGNMTEDTVLYVDGKPVTAEQAFIPETSSGTVDVTFTFDASNLGGYTLVAAEKAYRNGILIGVHTNIKDKSQTSNLPLVKTMAVNDETGDNLVRADEKAAFTDYVYYTNLQEGQTYRVRGTLKNKTTGETVKGKDGEDVTGFTEFNVKATSNLFTNTSYVEGGTAYAFSDKAGYKGMTKEEADALIASLTDAGLSQAEIVKYVNENGEAKEVAARRSKIENAVIFYFTNGQSVTIPLTEYTVLNGKTAGIEVTTTETAGEEKEGAEGDINETGGVDGIVRVDYAFDATSQAGLDTVVYEELYLVGADGTETLVADHKDLSDDNQTIKFTKIGTTLLDKASNSHKIAQGQTEITLIDTVNYENLIVGKTYTVTGTLHVKEKCGKYKAGDVLLGKDGNPVTHTVTFTAVSASGQVEVPFTISSDILPKSEIVAFEDVRDGNGTVAVHADINDEGQTVTPPTPNGPPKTGVIILTILGILAGLSAGVIVFTRKKRR